MIFCDIGRMLCIASIPLTLFLGIFTIVQLYIVSLIEGTLYVFFNIAEAACLPSVVPKEQLPAATAKNLSILSILWVGTPLWLLYVCASNIIVLTLITVALYFVIPGYDILQFSYRSALIPDHLQGRVNSVFRLIAFSGQPLGLALTGLLLQWIGGISTLLFFALCLIVLAIITMFNRSIRSVVLH